MEAGGSQQPGGVSWEGGRILAAYPAQQSPAGPHRVQRTERPDAVPGGPGPAGEQGQSRCRCGQNGSVMTVD